MAFDGSIEALIGADLTEYDKAMAEVVSATKKAFETAAQSASKSANQMIREVGELMNRLAKSNQSSGSKIAQGLPVALKSQSVSFNVSLRTSAQNCPTRFGKASSDYLTK